MIDLASMKQGLRSKVKVMVVVMPADSGGATERTKHDISLHPFSSQSILNLNGKTLTRLLTDSNDIHQRYSTSLPNMILSYP